MSISRITLFWLVAMVAAPAYGQSMADGAALGPVRCYIDATTISALENLNAKQLCTGAASEAPARCFAEAADRVGLVDTDAIQLCQAATSTAPALCAQNLDDTTTLTMPSIVPYCAALHWPLVPAPTGGSPECVEAALDRTDLIETEAARLCAGSASTAPVACFELGNEETALADSDLVDLCTTVVVASPYWAYSR